MNYYLFRLIGFLLPLYVLPLRFYYETRSAWAGGDDISKAAHFIAKKCSLTTESVRDKLLMSPCLAILCTQLHERCTNLDDDGLTQIDILRSKALTNKAYYEAYHARFQTRDPVVILDLLYHNRHIGEKTYNALLNPHHAIYRENTKSCRLLNTRMLDIVTLTADKQRPRQR